MTSTQLLVLLTIACALGFDFLNGFHDSANSIATVVSTRVLSPRLAVLWAAFFNFVAAFVFGTAVAKTIGSGMVNVAFVNAYVIMAGLLGAIVWDIVTWYFGLPTSSSHALIGGLAGAAVAKGGMQVILWSGWTKTLVFIVIAPLLGLIMGFFFMVAANWFARAGTPRGVDRWFRKLQLISAAAYSLGHGGNDAQKTMGIIAGALFAGGYITRHELGTTWGHYHWPIILAAQTAMGLGTYFGGWRIVHTMGSKITKLRPIGGFCAEAAAAITLFGTAMAGIPVSTTHTITGAIVGVGSVQRASAVRWGVAKRIVWAWILTIPAAALVSALFWWIMHLITPQA